MSKVFVDTNILVYANDASDPAKQQLAQSCLQDPDHTKVISTQVLREYFVTATKKLGISAVDAKRQL